MTVLESGILKDRTLLWKYDLTHMRDMTHMCDMAHMEDIGLCGWRVDSFVTPATHAHV